MHGPAITISSGGAMLVVFFVLLYVWAKLEEGPRAAVADLWCSLVGFMAWLMGEGRA